jgi:hypothetical protein
LGASDRSRREEVGIFHEIFEGPKDDENKFFNYFRMSVASFDVLHERLKEVFHNTKMRNCIQPVEMLAVTLRLVNKYNKYVYVHISIYFLLCTSITLCVQINKIFMFILLNTKKNERTRTIVRKK